MTYDTNNVFARILRKELDTPLVYEDEYVVAFKDINPQAPIHILVITKAAYTSFQDFMDRAQSDEIVGVMKGVSTTAAKMGAVENGYRLIANCGENSNQEVPHLHFHILGGKSLGPILPGSR